jgi:hypothetical protein
VFDDLLEDFSDEGDELDSQEQESMFMEFLNKNPTEAQFICEFPDADPVLLAWYWSVTCGS